MSVESFVELSFETFVGTPVESFDEIPDKTFDDIMENFINIYLQKLSDYTLEGKFENAYILAKKNF